MSNHEKIRHFGEDERLVLFPLSQQEADAIHRLIIWIGGYLDGKGEGSIDGYFELLMAYRSGKIEKAK